MIPEPPEGYRLAVKGETYDPGEDGKPAMWWNGKRWLEWILLVYPIKVVKEDYEDGSTYAIPESMAQIPLELSGLAEMAQINQELGLYGMTDNPLVRGT